MSKRNEPRQKLSILAHDVIRKQFTDGQSAKSLAEEFGVTAQRIYQITRAQMVNRKANLMAAREAERVRLASLKPLTYGMADNWGGGRGRPPRVPLDAHGDIRLAYSKGEPVKKLAAEFGLSVPRIYQIIRPVNEAKKSLTDGDYIL